MEPWLVILISFTTPFLLLALGFAWYKKCDSSMRDHDQERGTIEKVMRKYGLKLNELTARNRKQRAKDSLVSPSGPNRFTASPYHWPYEPLVEEEIPIPPRVLQTYRKFSHNRGLISLMELRDALRWLDVAVDNERADAVISELSDSERGHLDVDLREFAKVWMQLSRPISPPKMDPILESPPSPEKKAVKERPKVEGPKARALKVAEEKFQKKKEEEEAKKARQQALAEAQKALAEAQPLSDALRARAASEQEWEDCLERWIDSDAVEENAFRRPQLHAFRGLLRSAVERALKRWGVTVETINANISLGATSDEFLAFFKERVEKKYWAKEQQRSSLALKLPTSPTNGDRGDETVGGHDLPRRLGTYHKYSLDALHRRRQLRLRSRYGRHPLLRERERRVCDRAPNGGRINGRSSCGGGSSQGRRSRGFEGSLHGLGGCSPLVDTRAAHSSRAPSGCHAARALVTFFGLEPLGTDLSI